MNCPARIRQCPHGWNDCSLCANFKACESGTYIPEPEPTPNPNPEPILELEENELATDIGIVIPRERETWAERFASMTEDERWAEMYKYHPPSLHDKTPIPLDGPSAPGGGSKSKVKKSKTGNKVYTDVWEGI